jgi:signal transduction histidine kinase
LSECHQRSLDAAEATRKRIERDLHDGLQQRLVSIAMSLGLLDTRLPADPEAAKLIATEARGALAVALAELRELSQGIYPSVLHERGLTLALEELSTHAAVSCDLRISLDDPPASPVAAAAYFVVSEALTNIAKHAHASAARIEIRDDNGQMIVQIHDDGIGRAESARGSGLQGLTDRIEALGGRLAVISPTGRGTTIRAEIPAPPGSGARKCRRTSNGSGPRAETRATNPAHRLTPAPSSAATVPTCAIRTAR